MYSYCYVRSVLCILSVYCLCVHVRLTNISHIIYIALVINAVVRACTVVSFVKYATRNHFSVAFMCLLTVW